jgi:hypothetical protein
MNFLYCFYVFIRCGIFNFVWFDLLFVWLFQVNTATRTTVSMAYFQQLFNAKIIVTVNPANWEGDFRLWESMCSGALVFVDPLYVPHPYPLVGGEHVVFFDNNNRTDLFAKLDYYRAHPLEARRIAEYGYLFAMKYHRTVNMMDYILRSAHLKQVMVHNSNRMRIALEDASQKQLVPAGAPLQQLPLPRYYYTAQYLNYEASAQEKNMLICKDTGHYEPVPSDIHFNVATARTIVVRRMSCPAARAATAAAAELRKQKAQSAQRAAVAGRTSSSAAAAAPAGEETTTLPSSSSFSQKLSVAPAAAGVATVALPPSAAGGSSRTTNIKFGSSV